VTVTIVGVIADQLGAASQIVTVPYGDPYAGRNFDCRRQYLSVPSIHYRSAQPAAIAVDVNHGRVIGRVAYLEHAPNGQLHAVCEIDGSDLDGPLYYSPHIAHHDGRDIELRSLAVTRAPASVALPAIEAFAGTLADAASKIVYQHGHNGRLVKRARDYDRRRKHGEPLVIQGIERSEPPQAVNLEIAASASSAEHLWTRSAGHALDVTPRRREISLVVIPYDVAATVPHPVKAGRSATEVIDRRAFAGIESRAGRIRANREHKEQFTFGVATALDANRADGLHAAIKVAKTALGDETLALASDGCLDVSAGFSVPAGGLNWTSRNSYRVERATLRHISLVSDGAYGEHAGIVGVRAGV
jgi:phage head maturation protease